MGTATPEDWAEIFHGPCVRADVIRAVLETHGLRPILQRFGPQGWWAGAVLEDCVVYVPADEAAQAHELLSGRDPELEG